MNPIDSIAERRILEAQSRGEFDDLPGTGEPLVLDDDALIPEELRAVYRVLRNAGCVPPELESLRQFAELERLLERTTDDAEGAALLAKMRCLVERLPQHRGGRSLQVEADYCERVAGRLAARRGAT